MNTPRKRKATTKKEIPQKKILTSLFDPDKTKRLLRRVEPKIAKISQPWLRLIDTTSAIFLQDVVTEASGSHTNEILTLDDIQTTISSNPSFQFLHEATKDINYKDQRGVKEYVPAAKKKAASANFKANSKSSTRHLKTNNADDGTMGSTIAAAAAALDSQPVVASMDVIVPDDDDYD